MPLSLLQHVRRIVPTYATHRRTATAPIALGRKHRNTSRATPGCPNGSKWEASGAIGAVGGAAPGYTARRGTTTARAGPKTAGTVDLFGFPPRG